MKQDKMFGLRWFNEKGGSLFYYRLSLKGGD